MELDEWLERTPALALKEFADGITNVESARKPRLIAFILADPCARDVALESKRIEGESRAWRKEHPKRRI